MAKFTIKLRRGPAAEWTTDNPVLSNGEPGFEDDTGKLKIGDGVQAWVDLEYYPPGTIVAGVASVDGRTGTVTLADLYSALAHGHAQADVTGLTASLAGKSDTSHTHGSTLVVARKKVTTGHFSNSNTSGAYIVANNGTEDLTVTLPAVVGDYISVSLAALLIASTSMFLEYAVLNSGSIIQFGSTNTDSPSFEGDPSLYPNVSFIPIPGLTDFIVTEPMLDDGYITVGIVFKGAGGAGQIFGTSDYPARLSARNHGLATIV